MYCPVCKCEAAKRKEHAKSKEHKRNINLAKKLVLGLNYDYSNEKYRYKFIKEIDDANDLFNV